jgi:hypothetical protein
LALSNNTLKRSLLFFSVWTAARSIKEQVLALHYVNERWSSTVILKLSQNQVRRDVLNLFAVGINWRTICKRYRE